MIKLVYVAKRRDDVAPKDFYEYWLRSHAPRVRGHAEAIGARKYVQSHMLDIPDNEVHRAMRGMLPPAAGITEVWWDSLESYQAALATQAARDAFADLTQDEATFIDMAGSCVFYTQEHVIFDDTAKKPLGPDSTKIVYLVSKRDDISVEECHRTWLEDHGALVKRLSTELNLNRAKYVQSHTIAPKLNAHIAKARGSQPPLDGVTEVWIADPSIAVPPEDGRKANELLIADERRFVEMSRSRRFMTKEHVIFEL